MKQYVCAALGALTMLTGASLAKAAGVPVSRQIRPGVGIGTVGIGERVSTLHLGPPTFGDGAAGTIWNTWNAGKPETGTGIVHTVDVLAHLGTGDHVVAIVRVTSPWFRTAAGLGAGSTYGALRKAFPAIRKVGAYSPHQVPITVAVYDDRAQGIAFELLCDGKGSVGPTARCLAVDVHAPGKAIEAEPWLDYLESKASLELK